MMTTTSKPTPIPYRELATNLDEVFARVAHTNESFVVIGDDGTHVMIAPVRADMRRKSSKVDPDEAFERAFGGWRGVIDGEELKAEIRATRSSRRPAVEL